MPHSHKRKPPLVGKLPGVVDFYKRGNAVGNHRNNNPSDNSVQLRVSSLIWFAFRHRMPVRRLRQSMLLNVRTGGAA